MAAGIGKQYGNITVKTLYEAMDVNSSSKLYSGDQAHLTTLQTGFQTNSHIKFVLTGKRLPSGSFLDTDFNIKLKRGSNSNL